MRSDRRDSDYISPWGYIGYSVLWSLPMVGWIIWIVNCFSSKENVKNYARSIFCAFLIALIFIGLVVALIVGGFAMGLLTPETLPNTIPQPMV